MPPFKGLSDRFKAKEKDLYNKYSTRDGGPSGRNEEPFLEFKPNSPNRRETAHDTRFLPIGSVKRDFTRLSKYLVTNDGLTFLIREAVMQAANTFTETRIYNPLFVIGNVQPYVRVRRSLSTPASFAVTGDRTQMSPASADANIQGAGRLQKRSMKAAVSRVIGNSTGPQGLLALLGADKLLGAITGIFSIRDNGSAGVNQRPELNVQGEYFSILSWKGYKKQQSLRSTLDVASANLRIGNFKGAVDTIRSGVDSFIHGFTSGIGGTIRGAPQGRDMDTVGIEGRRYFITNAMDADRYLKNSISFTVGVDNRTRPVPYTVYLNRTPYVLGPGITAPAPAVPTPNQLQRSLVDQVTRVGQSAVNAMSQFPPIPFVPKPPTPAIAGALELSSENPAEDSMMFKNLSLHHRYDNDARIEFIREQLKAQKERSATYWNTQQKNLGFYGGIRAGEVQNIDPRVRSKHPGYLIDTLNSIDFITNGQATDISPEVTARVRGQYGEDLIEVQFLDFVNKNVIPFRAYISNVTETVNPEVNDTRYIGRIDRNVVYVGVQRDLSFSLAVWAFSKMELRRIWRKINYMTGMCYPAQYSNGFMVPPLVKLTIGDLYKNQPGYLRSLTHSVLDGTPWEIEQGSQLPHGIDMHIAFSIIEKRQMDTQSNFYSTTPQPQAPNSPISANKLSTDKVLGPVSQFG